jgi:hypothetical protein
VIDEIDGSVKTYRSNYTAIMVRLIFARNMDGIATYRASISCRCSRIGSIFCRARKGAIFNNDSNKVMFEYSRSHKRAHFILGIEKIEINM